MLNASHSNAESARQFDGNSCLYAGVVRHHRRLKFEHAFQYRLFQLYLDLGELDDLFRRRLFWSTSRPAVARFKRSDHLGDPTRPLDQCVGDLIEQRTGVRPSGPIRLLTHLRYWGFQMNPVSFYYCFDSTDSKLDFVVAEVNNTPWSEQHCYVLPCGIDAGNTAKPSLEKEFHVSPFFPMEMTYRWQISYPGESLQLQIQNWHRADQVFEAELSLERMPLSSWNLTRVLLQHPWMTGKVFFAIYWQALKLWWKGATYSPHPHKGRSSHRVGENP